jgi:hypothetical protein
VFGAGVWLSLPADGEAALTISNYAGGAAVPVNVSLSPADTVGLVGKTVAFDAAALDDISVARLHYIRKSFADTGAVIGVAAADPAKLTSVFNSGEWVQGALELIRFSLYDTYKVANKFTDAGMKIMNGIKLARDGSDDKCDDKCKIVYGRDIKVGDLAYASGGLWPTNGIGLAQEEKGNIIPGTAIKIHGGRFNDINYNDVAFSDFAAYIALLDSINANPIKTGIRPDSSSVQITSIDSNSNVISNEIYDFVLDYYNPDAASDEAERARLPQWMDTNNIRFSYTFDGLAIPPDDTPDLVVNGVRLDNMNRKSARSISGSPSSYGTGGDPRADFGNNITVLMSNYLVSTLGVEEFRNTNIMAMGING